MFNVDGLKKKQIQKNYIRSSKVASSLSVSFFILIGLFTVVFLIYGFGLKDTFIVQDITDSNYGLKDSVSVWFVLVTVDFILALLWFMQKLVVNIVLGKYINQRINESLIISNGEIEYGYQNLVGASSGDRVIVKIPFANISTIRTDQRVKKIEILGMVSSKYYENYSQKKTRAPKNNYKEGSFILFDYFEPGLIEFLEKNYAEKLEVK